MANTYHAQLGGTDLHPNKIDATTGTELTVPSQTNYDGRWHPKNSITGLQSATSTQAGVLSNADWSLFNNKAYKTGYVVGLSNIWGNDYTGNGTSDNVALQAALNAINTDGSGEMYIRSGTFKIATGIGGATVGQYSNLSIRGSGRGQTILQATAGVPIITLGSGDATPGNIWRNIRISDMTIDMNNQVGACYGIALGICQDVILENIHFKNQKNGAKSMLFWGASTGASSALLPRNLIVKDCIFETSDAGWEMVTLAQGLNAKFINCTFRNKSSIYAFLNYGTHDVSLIGCHFENCGNGVNGFGMTKFIGCDFYNAGVTVQSYNTSFLGCTWDYDQFSTTQGNGIQFLGYDQGPSEIFWDAIGANAKVSLKNNKVMDCTFKRGNPTAISAGTFIGSDGLRYLSCDDLEVADCSFELSNWQAIDVKARYLILNNLTAYNSGQLGTSSVKYNFVFGAKKGYVNRLRSYDNQTTPTVTRDFFIDNQYAADALPDQDLTFSDNTFSVSGTPYYYSGGGFTSAQPTSVTLHNFSATGTSDLAFLNGKVGIGTTLPGARLDIGANTDIGTTTSLRVLGYSNSQPLQEWGDGTGSVYTRILRMQNNQMMMTTSNLNGLPFLFNGFYQFGGSVAYPLTTKTAAYTLTATDSVILADATTAAFTVTLPTAAGCQGRQYTIKKVDSSANAVTIASTSGNIDGAATKALSTQWQAARLVSDGANWFVV